MKKLLLTGFEPFLDHPINPTVDIVKELDGSTINSYKIFGKILTVDFAKSGDQLLREIKEVQPDAVISLGLAGGRHKVTPERIAMVLKIIGVINLMDKLFLTEVRTEFLQHFL